MDTVVTLTRREMHCLQPLLRGGRRTIIADIALETEAAVLSVPTGLMYSDLRLLFRWIMNLGSCTKCLTILLPDRELQKLQQTR